ncbi:MAG: prolyl oligopeptidase family serine peptidase [Caulobacteraceae bacterium]
MRSIVLALALATVSLPALAAVPAGPPTTFQARDLFSLEYAADPQIRPDGGMIAYARTSEDIMTDRAHRAIWLVDPKTGAQQPLAGAGTASQSGARWSPDGSRLAYVSTDEAHRPQLFVRWMNTGAVTRVADLPQAPGSIAWSPDGSKIAFTMLVPDEGAKLGSSVDKPEGAQWAAPLNIITRVHYREDNEGYLKSGYDQLFVVTADGGAPRQLTYGQFDASGRLSWTPDGSAILFSSNHDKGRELQDSISQIFQITLADGAVKALTARHGPNQDAVVSPDGREIAWVAYDDRLRGYENTKLFVMNRDGTGMRSISDSLDRSVEHPEWAADGRSLVFQYTDHGISKVARIGLDGHLTPIAEGMAGSEPDRPYSGGEYSVSAKGVVAFTAGDAAHLGNLAIAQDGKTKLLTSLNADLFAGKTLARVEHVTVPSSYDKRPIDAWVMTPPGFDPARKYPMILEIHGGPFAAYGPNFASELQLYAAAGYVVLYANPRGSTSYGDEFANLINDNYPSQDYDDLMSAVDAVIARGSVDPNNLFVTGGSGGGLLTAWIVGKTNRFKAAVTQKPVIDWTSEVLTTDGYADMTSHWFAKPPWEDPMGYWKRSPLSLVGNVTTPTAVMVGEEDHRTPGSEAEQFFQALQIRQVPTALIRVPGASHEALADRPSQEGAEASAILAWFGRYRTDRPASAGGV